MSGGAAEAAQMAAVPAMEASLPGTADLVAEFRAIEAEMGEAGEEPETAPETPDAKTKPAKGGEKPNEKTDGKPTVAERAKFREEKRAAKQAHLEREQQLSGYEQKLRAADAEIQRRAAEIENAPPAKLRAMFESGKLDEFAKALGIDGVDTWEKANDHAARLFASPEYKRMREQDKEIQRIKDDAAKKEAADKQAREEWQTEREREQYAQRRTAAIAEIGTSLKTHDDEHIAALAEKDQRFAPAILAAIEKNPSLDVEEAAEQVRDQARAFYDTLHEVFGGTQAPRKPEATQVATPVRAGSQKPLVRPSKHVNRSTASEASPPADENLTDAQWLALAQQEMRGAYRADEETREKARSR